MPQCSRRQSIGQCRRPEGHADCSKIAEVPVSERPENGRGDLVLQRFVDAQQVGSRRVDRNTALQTAHAVQIISRAVVRLAASGTHSSACEGNTASRGNTPMMVYACSSSFRM